MKHLDPITRRWIRTEADRKAVADSCRFREDRALHIRTFFERFLRHSKGKWAGQPFTLLDWQYQDVIAPVFGWYRADGTRRFRRCYVEVPKKNGKSTLGAGIGLALLVADDEPGAEIYSCATKREQAAIVHDEAIRMLRKSPDLLMRLRVNMTTRTIFYESKEAKYAALASDSEGTEGINPSGLIVDELHAWNDWNFWRTLRYGDIARRQPLMFMITTAGIFDPDSIGFQEHEYAGKILDGVLENDDYFVYIRGAEEQDDLADPAVQKAANPSYGTIIQPAEIAKAVADVQERPSELSVLQRYRFNIWVRSVQNWLELDHWDKCADVPRALEGRVCFAGLDLATVKDIAALVLWFPPETEDGKHALLPFFFVPEIGARERQKMDRVPYVDWAEQGLLTLTEGNVIDYRTIRKRVNELGKQYAIREIGYDPYNAEQLCNQQLGEEDGFVTVPVRQGAPTMSGPSKEFEKLVLSERLAHGGNPILRWMANNVTLRIDPHGNIKPDKRKSREKIDGITAAIVALSRALGADAEVAASVYGTRGLLTI